MFYGVDISYAQGNYQPNTESFIIINASRANVGLVVGSMYHTQVQTARAHGKEVGHYFFNGNIDPVTCANFFVDNLYDLRSGDVLVLDVESEGSTGTVAWSPAQTLAFAKQVKARTGVTIGVYLNRSLMDGADWSAVVAYGCWLWIAYYNSTPPPIKWWPSWTLWQWTSVGVDKNQAKQSLAQIRTSVTGGGATPLPNPMIPKDEDMPQVRHRVDGAVTTYALYDGIYWQETVDRSTHIGWEKFYGASVLVNDPDGLAYWNVRTAYPRPFPYATGPVATAASTDLSPVLDAIKAIPASSGPVDLSPVLAAIHGLKLSAS